MKNNLSWRDKRPACARNVKPRLPMNCTHAPAIKAGKRAWAGAMSMARTQVEKIEKSTSEAPLPTTSARPKRQARVSSGSDGTH